MKKIQNPWLSVEGYCCPGCCPTNEKGLRLEFWEDGDDIVSRWQPAPEYQSWRDTLHGGIQCLMLDEVAGWVVFRKLQTMGSTARMDTRYIKPMNVREEVTMRARIVRHVRNAVVIDAELYQHGEICSRASVTYFCATPQQTREAYGFTGCPLEGE